MIDRLLALTVHNPLVIKSVRSRMRLKQMIPWTVVMLTVTGFVSTIVYLVQIERSDVTPEQAARNTLLPIIIVQAVLMMLTATGRVGAGVAQEREDGLLDYQRLTPMHPAAKLIGYLFGLPIREYALFAMTLPMLAFGIIKGGFSASTVLHFYTIFFSSVIVYHMTAIVAGMLSRRPRSVAFISYFMVLLLYFVLPLLSHIGFTFFEFLTIRPALFGLITQEIERIGGTTQAIADARFTALDSFRDIPFFGFTIQPGLYSLMVQGALVIALWTVAYRKWRSDTALPFSKIFSVVFFTAVCVFILGSVWPILKDDAVLAQLLGHLDSRQITNAEVIRTEASMFAAIIILCVSAGIMLLLGILCIFCTTPNVHRVTSGSRRAARQGLKRVPLRTDEASGLYPIAVSAIVAATVYAVIVSLAVTNERFIVDPTPYVLFLPVIFVGVMLVFLQTGLERFGMRATFVSVFLLWMVPFFSAVLVGAAFELEVLSSYVALPFPPAAIGFMGAELFRIGVPTESLSDGAPPFTDHLSVLSLLPVLLYAGLALPMVLSVRRRNATLMRRALEEEGV